MNLRPRYFSFLFLLVSFWMTSCSTVPETQPMDSLREFYQSYIKESSKLPGDDQQISALKKKHCTARFLGELDKAELEADPFLNAQDVEEQWASNLEINPEAGSKDKFQVCYTASFDNAKHCVEVSMVKEGENWMIDNVK